MAEAASPGSAALADSLSARSIRFAIALLALLLERALYWTMRRWLRETPGT